MHRIWALAVNIAPAVHPPTLGIPGSVTALAVPLLIFSTHRNMLRSMCEFHPNVGVALELTEVLPSASEMERWQGEPVKAVILPTNIFLSNR